MRNVDIDPKQLSKQNGTILRPGSGIVGRSAVAHTDIKITVRPKFDHSAVMIREWLRDREQHFFGRDIAGIRRPGPACRRVLGDHCRTGSDLRVINVELAVRGELGMKCKAEQSSLIAGRARYGDLRTQIDEIGRNGRAGLEHLDYSALLDDKYPLRTILGSAKQDRAAEPLQERLKPRRIWCRHALTDNTQCGSHRK